MNKNYLDTVDKLIVHLAQSKLNTDEVGIENTLSWRWKSGELSKKDNECIKWAIKWLNTHTEIAIDVGENKIVVE